MVMEKSTMKINEAIWKMLGGLCVAMAVLMITNGRGKKQGVEQAVHADEAGHEEHADHEGHGHAEEASSVSIEERASEKCEHDIPISDCTECRYEIGLVRVDGCLLKKENGEGLLRTQKVARTRMAAVLPATGEVALNENAAVHISPRVSGIIESVSVDIGARVKKGDSLLTLASVELGRALAEYERNRTLSELSEKVFLRESKLREQKVGSEQEMIDAQMAFEQHKAELRASEQALHVLGLTEEDLARMRERSHGDTASFLPIRAPMAGTIIEKHAVPGEMAEPGKDLMLLCDLSSVWVWANVHSRDLAQLLEAEKNGSVPVEISVAAFPDRKFKGTLDYVSATMNEQSRTVKVRATVENPNLELRPGMFCEAAIGLGQEEEVLAAPQTAVLTDEGETFVFKHWKDDFFVRQNIQKGRESFGMIEILEGLQDGETVVTDGAFLLKSDVLREKMGAGCAD
jgi:cobalt-zinc-cadmium efflux system membrane fusion protein